MMTEFSFAEELPLWVRLESTYRNILLKIYLEKKKKIQNVSTVAFKDSYYLLFVSEKRYSVCTLWSIFPAIIVCLVFVQEMWRLASLANLIFVSSVYFGMKWMYSGFNDFFKESIYCFFYLWFCSPVALCNEMLILLPCNNESHLLQIR